MDRFVRRNRADDLRAVRVFQPLGLAAELIPFIELAGQTAKAVINAGIAP
jgi:hypothetical protein